MLRVIISYVRLPIRNLANNYEFIVLKALTSNEMMTQFPIIYA